MQHALADSFPSDTVPLFKTRSHSMQFESTDSLFSNAVLRFRLAPMQRNFHRGMARSYLMQFYSKDSFATQATHGHRLVQIQCTSLAVDSLAECAVHSRWLAHVSCSSTFPARSNLWQFLDIDSFLRNAVPAMWLEKIFPDNTTRYRFSPRVPVSSKQ